MASKLNFKLASIKAKTYDGGSITNVTSNETPGFVNISFCMLKLNKGGSLEPIWHPNANKIGYCIEGTALVSIRTPSGVEIFTIKSGDLFFIPEGYVHHISNIGELQTSIAFTFNNSKPEEMTLANAVRSLSNEVFNATFNTSANFLEGLKKSKESQAIRSLPIMKRELHEISSRFKFNLSDSSKPYLTKGGYLQDGTKKNLPVLDGLGILGFELNPKGIVEPHWHTNAGELVFIVKGKTRITVLSPDGKVEVMEVNANEGAFAPASHFHNIENIGNEKVEVVAFFNNAEPDYIGLGEVVGSCSNELLGSIFDVSPNYFEAMKKIEKALVIVPV